MGGKHHREHKPLSNEEFAELPPKPDPETGQPFPPEAPTYTGPSLRPGQERAPMAGTPPRGAKAPDEMGRPLVWRVYGAKEGLRGLLFTLIIAAILIALPSLMRGQGFEAWTYWQMWVIAFVGAWLMADPMERRTVSAGADWIQWNRRPKWYQSRRDRTNYLKFYRLAEIEGYAAGAVLYLRMRDEDGRGIDRIRAELQSDRRIWDLVYNGILHSVANGAEINRSAIEMLRLENSVALEIRERHQH
jgi:hypothetical protein